MDIKVGGRRVRGRMPKEPDLAYVLSYQASVHGKRAQKLLTEAGRKFAAVYGGVGNGSGKPVAPVLARVNEVKPNASIWLLRKPPTADELKALPGVFPVQAPALQMDQVNSYVISGYISSMGA